MMYLFYKLIGYSKKKYTNEQKEAVKTIQIYYRKYRLLKEKEKLSLIESIINSNNIISIDKHGSYNELPIPDDNTDMYWNDDFLFYLNERKRIKNRQ